MILLLLFFFTLPIPNQSIKIVRPSVDISVFDGQSGAELLHSSFDSLGLSQNSQELSICSRDQYLHHCYHEYDHDVAKKSQNYL